jgi:hypothetical protein
MVDISLLLLVAGFILVAVLIFKFIKRMLYAVLSLVGLVLLIVGSLFGVVFLDYQYLTSQENMTLHMVYAQDGTYELGTSLPIREQQPVVEEMYGTTAEELSGFEDSFTKKDGILLSVEKGLLEDLLGNRTFSLPLEGASSIDGYDLQLSSEEVLTILNAEGDGVDTLLDILFEKNSVPQAQQDLAREQLTGQIRSELERNDLTLKEAMFGYVVQDSIQQRDNVLALIEGFKNERLDVRPERFSYKLFRLLPATTLKNFLEDSVLG